MRRIAIAVMSTISGLVLLFSYHTSLSSGGGGSAVTVAAPIDTATSSPTPSDAAAGSPSPAARSTRKAAAKPSGTTGTFTGDVADTRWGPVQVQIVVKANRIVNATAVQFPNGNDHDQEINSYAIPQLQQATVSVGNANFDSISGATITSDGYKTSLQSALDKAHL